MLGTILLWHYRPRHRFDLKSEKARETQFNHPGFDRKCDEVTFQIEMTTPCSRRSITSRKLLRIYIHNVGSGVHNFVLVLQLGVDAMLGTFSMMKRWGTNGLVPFIKSSSNSRSTRTSTVCGGRGSLLKPLLMKSRFMDAPEPHSPSGDQPLFETVVTFTCIYNGNLASLTCWVVEWSMGSFAMASAIHSTGFHVVFWSGEEHPLKARAANLGECHLPCLLFFSGSVHELRGAGTRTRPE